MKSTKRQRILLLISNKYFKISNGDILNPLCEEEYITQWTKDKDKRTESDLHNTTQKTKDRTINNDPQNAMQKTKNSATRTQ